MEELFKEIYHDKSDIKIWKKLENGCFIGTMNYSKKNVWVLKELLKSFEEQYGEQIDYKAAQEELLLYTNRGKLFIYFDENFNPVSMNGCIYDYDNATIDFISDEKKNLHSLYFYGLSTLKHYRGKGACTHLIQFAVDYAKSLGFDYVYARTDLINSNSEKLMTNAGLQLCKFHNMIITEWVDVRENVGDYRLHLYLPFSDVEVKPKGDYFLADNTKERKIRFVKKKEKEKNLCMKL